MTLHIRDVSKTYPNVLGALSYLSFRMTAPS